MNGCRRLTHRRATLPGFSVDSANGLRVEVLGPVVTQDQGKVEFATFSSPEQPNGSAIASHTLSGHSVVLKFFFGNHTFLFASDMNIPTQQHLLRHYEN